MGWARSAWLVPCGLLLILLLAACSNEGGLDVTASPQNVGQPDASTAPAATTVIIPTLYPTVTRPASAASTATSPPSDTPTPESTVDFEQPVVELRYQIPALGLDRRLEANVNGEITVVDETRGLARVGRNQGGVIIELQQALPDLSLEPLPDGCEACVAFSYELPMVDSSAQGWLTDTVMLASVEHYTSLMVGAHFPEDTVLGLRRSATPFDVAHSLALTTDGQLWRWLATEPEVSPAVAAAESSPQLAAMVGELDTSALADSYEVPCQGTSGETLYLNQGGEETTVLIRCPAFSLPSTLLPLYLELDAALQPVVAEQGLQKPPLQIPLDTMIAYRLSDGSQLTLGLDGAARLSMDSEVYTETIGVEQVMSLNEQLLATEQLDPGVEAYGNGEVQDVLLVRGPQGMMEAAWQGAGPPAELEALVSSLQTMINDLAGATLDESEALEATPEPTPTATSDDDD
jgi:hypothetical protein